MRPSGTSMQSYGAKIFPINYGFSQKDFWRKFQKFQDSVIVAQYKLSVYDVEDLVSPAKKRCPNYDTKLHLITKLQFKRSAYPYVPSDQKGKCQFRSQIQFKQICLKMILYSIRLYAKTKSLKCKMYVNYHESLTSTHKTTLDGLIFH